MKIHACGLAYYAWMRYRIARQLPSGAGVRRPSTLAKVPPAEGFRIHRLISPPGTGSLANLSTNNLAARFNTPL